MQKKNNPYTGKPSYLRKVICTCPCHGDRIMHFRPCCIGGYTDIWIDPEINVEGFKAEIQYDCVNDTFFGTITGIHQIIVFEGNSNGELKNAFLSALLLNNLINEKIQNS